jgi:hypothetical protein
MRWGIVTAAAMAAATGACASYSETVAATYVSPIIYENLSCRQIAEESARVSRRTAEAAGVQDSQAPKDSVVTGGAIVVFWPLWAVTGEMLLSSHASKAKWTRSSRRPSKKNCGIQFRRR